VLQLQVYSPGNWCIEASIGSYDDCRFSLLYSFCMTSGILVDDNVVSMGAVVLIVLVPSKSLPKGA